MLQSSTNLSSSGFQFSPVNQQALLLFEITTKSLISCTQTCYSTAGCRIFDFDDQSHRCRIFQGDIATMGSLITSTSTGSRVGSMQLRPEYFSNQGQPCSFCQGSRYLTCINVTCQCRPYTYFDGSMCQSQKLLGAVCNISTQCRIDLNYTCLSSQQCGVASPQISTIVGGYGNGTGGSSLNALLSPVGLSAGVDNSLYVSDYGNHRVIKLQAGSSVGVIVAGTGTGGSSYNQLNGPTGLHVDTSLNIYVVDSQNYRVMLWYKNASTGIKVAGGSSGNTLNSFASGAGRVFVDSQGNIFLCDSGNQRIMKWAANATNAIIVAGTGSAGSGSQELNIPYGLDVDELNSYLYVADYSNHRIQRYHIGVSTNGTTVAGGIGAGAGSNQLNSPYSVRVSKMTGAIYISDSGNDRIQCWNSGATSGTTIAGIGASNNNYSIVLNGIRDITLDINEVYVFAADTNNNRIWRFTLS